MPSDPIPSFDEFKKSQTPGVIPSFADFQKQQAPGIKAPQVNMQEQPVSRIPLEAEKALTRYTGNLNVENPLRAVDTGANYLSTKLSQVPGLNKSLTAIGVPPMTDYGTQFQRDVNVNPLEFPKQIGHEVANGEYGNAAGDVASVLTPFAGEAPKGLQLAEDVAKGPISATVKGAVKGGYEAAKAPMTVPSMTHAVLNPVTFLGGLAGHHIAPHLGVPGYAGFVAGASTAAKIPEILKGAYEGGKEAFNEGKPTLPNPSQFETSTTTANRMKYTPSSHEPSGTGFAPIPRKGPGPLAPPAEQPAPEPFKPNPVTAQRMKYGGPSQPSSGQGFGKPVRQGTNRAMEPKPEVEEPEATTPEKEEPPPSATQPTNAKAEKLAAISQAIERKGKTAAHYFDKQGKPIPTDLIEYEKHIPAMEQHAVANKLEMPASGKLRSPGKAGFAAEREAAVEALKELQKNKK